MPETSAYLHPVQKFVEVKNPQEAVTLQMFSVGNNVSYMNLIPDIARSSKTGDRQNVEWIVNSYLDLATLNHRYNL